MSISRVSTYQLNKAFTGQISNTQNKFNKLAQQIGTGIKVSSMADDPVSAKSILKTNTELDNIALYTSNIQQGDLELELTDKTLMSINDQVQKAYDLAMEVANGTYGEQEIEAYQQSLDAIISNIKTLANTKYGDQYIFSGTKTTTEPYSLDDAEGLMYNGDFGSRYAIIGENKTEQLNFLGKNIFGEASFTVDSLTGDITLDDTKSSGIFGALYSLKEAIQDASNVDDSKLRNAMADLKTGQDTVTGARTKTGAVGQSFEDMLAVYENDTLNLKELRSNLQDTDLPSAISDWYNVYQSLQASYQMMSQTQNVTLLNYI